MSPREAANKWFPGLISAIIVAIVSFVIQAARDDTQAQNKKIDEMSTIKADKTYVDKEIEAAKREMDGRRDADYREFKTDLKYIKEGIDELKKNRR